MNMTDLAAAEATIVSAEAEVSTAIDKLGLTALPGWLDAIIKAFELFLSTCGVATVANLAQYPRVMRMRANTFLLTHPHALDGAQGLSRANAVDIVCEIGKGVTVEKATAFKNAVAA